MKTRLFLLFSLLSLLACPAGNGDSCTTDTDCTDGLVCVNQICQDPGLCFIDGLDCTVDAECCSGSCSGGVCVSAQCAGTDAPCQSNGDCCSQQCGPAGTCLVAQGCTESEQPCSVNGDCCSNACINQVCAAGGNCTSTGASCTNNTDCCSNSCDPNTLTCVAQNDCLATDQACLVSTDCCSNICANGFCSVVAAGDITCGVGGDQHICECANGIDDDGDGGIDTAVPNNDPQCLGPADDNELEFATGIPGDNNGANGATECPFDGNSGPGNDNLCAQFLPNGCDCSGCCSIDGNGNNTSENVFVGGGNCRQAPPSNVVGTEGGPCDANNACGTVDINGQTVPLNCVNDGDGSASYCSTCVPCQPQTDCQNSCNCCEICTGPQNDPTCDPVTGSQCVGGQVCETNIACTADTDCNTTIGETCTNGVCNQKVCADSTECLPGTFCSLGCCVFIP